MMRPAAPLDRAGDWGEIQMNILKTFTLTWWQTGLFKVGMLALGLVIGAHWHGIVATYIPALGIVAVISLAYVSYVWLKQ
jgi:hypothetical protein